MNPYEGKVPLEHAGRTVELQFSWAAIAALQQEFGNQDYLHRIGAILDTKEAAGMAILISHGSGWSLAEVMNWSPPLMTSAKALERAWLLALFGPSMKPEKSDADPLPAQLMKNLMSFVTRFTPRSEPASAGPNSGEPPPTRPD